MVFEIDEQGLIQGSCKFYENEILVADVNHKNGVVEGNVLNCYPTGELYSETNYVNGKKDGIETLYDKKGNRIAELTYSNDLLNGAMMLFFSNGRMAEKHIIRMVGKTEFIWNMHQMELFLK